MKLIYLILIERIIPHSDNNCFYLFTIKHTLFHEMMVIISTNFPFVCLTRKLKILNLVIVLQPSSLSMIFFFIFFFYLWWILSYIEMKQPWVYMCSPSQSPLPPPSPSRFPPCTRSERLSHASNLGW